MEELNTDFNPVIAGVSLEDRNASAVLPSAKFKIPEWLVIDHHYLYSAEVVERYINTKDDPREFPQKYSDLVFIKVHGRNLRSVEKELVDQAGNSKSVMPLTEYLTRYLSTFLTKHVWIRLPIRAETICFLSLLFIIIGSLFFLPGLLWTNLVAAILIITGFALDCCDGETARVKLQSTPYGAWLDSTYDRVGEAFMIIMITSTLTVWYAPWLAILTLAGTYLVHLTGAYVPQNKKLSQPTGGARSGKVRIDWFDFGRSTQVFIYPALALFNIVLPGLILMCLLNHAYWIQRIPKYKKALR